VEHAAEVRPLFARAARLRVSRPVEVAINSALAFGERAGGLTLRFGSMRERWDNQRTPTLQRWAVETEWLQPLTQRESLEISLHLWASHLHYSNGDKLSWLRPQIELRYQPDKRLGLMLGYALRAHLGQHAFPSRPHSRKAGACTARLKAIVGQHCVGASYSSMTLSKASCSMCSCSRAGASTASSRFSIGDAAPGVLLLGVRLAR
jgi:hypothetical protein